jgi:hypothetical protein
LYAGLRLCRLRVMENQTLPPHLPVVIAYEHRYRLVLATRIWQSKAGNWLVTGLDPDRPDEQGNPQYRSFRVDRIRGSIKLKR